MSTQTTAQTSQCRSRLRRVGLLVALAASATLLFGASQAMAAFEIETFDGTAKEQDGSFDVQAGSHPFEMTTDVRFHTIINPEFLIEVPDEGPKDLEVSLPPGSIGNPQATPKCTQAQLALIACPNDTAVGTTELELAGVGFTGPLPVYNIVPPPGLPARFAFNLVTAIIAIDAHVRSGGDYGLTTTIHGIPQTFTLIGSNLSFWGVPADHGHDELRGTCAPNIVNEFNPPVTECPSNAEPKPFITLPSNCSAGPLTTTARADSWQHPGVWTEASFESHVEGGVPAGVEGCEDLSFHPKISVQTQSSAAETPSGVSVELEDPQNDGPFGLATPNLKKSVTVLPEGLSINASAANGLSGCAPAQIGLDNGEAPSCPNSSKIGTIEVESPLMTTPMKGSIYEASQNDNPFGSTLAFYTFSEAEGVALKLAAEIKPDPQIGQLTTTFDNNPELPFSDLRLDFFGGSLAPLVTPPNCGTFTTEEQATPWSAADPNNPTLAELATSTSSFEITSGPNGGACANASQERPFSPSFSAGVQSPIAGAFSPFVLRLSRQDGTPGAEGDRCDAASGPARQAGRDSLLLRRADLGCRGEDGNRRAGSSVLPRRQPGRRGRRRGRRGPEPLFPGWEGLPGRPLQGRAAVAGDRHPGGRRALDLGNTVVRAALFVDPVTAQVHVVSDPLPSILDGIPLKLRSVRVDLDRSQFTVNPTGCEPTSVTGAIGSLQGASANVSDRFQIGACAALGFKPKLTLRLKGGTNRGQHPALRATLRIPSGSANIGHAAVTLPRSEFLDQGHIGTVCTRAQFAANQCPAASVYGHARAFSPLLDQPLEGPVYLRSSDHKLPDLVADLNGQIDIDVAARIDSVHRGIRTTFAAVPDAPVSKFVLTMAGGKKGLLVNSTDICAGTHRAAVRADAHNSRVSDYNPILNAGCAKPGKPRKRRHR